MEIVRAEESFWQNEYQEVYTWTPTENLLQWEHTIFNNFITLC